MITTEKRPFAKLGYSHLDTAQIVTILNKLLASYSVYQQKLKNFHWNITGQDFFELHELFEKMYSRANDEIDEIAERIRLFGQTPVSSFTAYLSLSEVKENNIGSSAFEMTKIALGDIRELLSQMEEGIYAALDIGDNGTDYMLKKFIYNLEKEHWMLTSWVKQMR